jgi:hypothetical protein
MVNISESLSLGSTGPAHFFNRLEFKSSLDQSNTISQAHIKGNKHSQRSSIGSHQNKSGIKKGLHIGKVFSTNGARKTGHPHRKE